MFADDRLHYYPWITLYIYNRRRCKAIVQRFWKRQRRRRIISAAEAAVSAGYVHTGGHHCGGSHHYGKHRTRRCGRRGFG